MTTETKYGLLPDICHDRGVSYQRAWNALMRGQIVGRRVKARWHVAEGQEARIREVTGDEFVRAQHMGWHRKEGAAPSTPSTASAEEGGAR